MIPYRLSQGVALATVVLSVALAAAAPLAIGAPHPLEPGATIERGDAVALFRQALADPTLAWLTAKQAYQFRYMAQHVSELRGKTLLCYCSLDHPCHVDVICEFANQ